MSESLNKLFVFSYENNYNKALNIFLNDKDINLDKKLVKDGFLYSCKHNYNELLNRFIFNNKYKLSKELLEYGIKVSNNKEVKLLVLVRDILSGNNPDKDYVYFDQYKKFTLIKEMFSDENKNINKKVDKDRSFIIFKKNKPKKIVRIFFYPDKEHTKKEMKFTFGKMKLQTNIYNIINFYGRLQDDIDDGEIENPYLNIVELENIVKVQALDNYYYVAMKFFKGKNLYRYIIENRGSIEPTFLIDKMLEIISAIQFIHKRGYAYLNLKLEEIQIDESNNSRIKLINFKNLFKIKDNFSEFISFEKGGDSERKPIRIGNYSKILEDWMIPKFYIKSGIDPRIIDIWSLGIIFFYMIVLRLDYRMMDIVDKEPHKKNINRMKQIFKKFNDIKTDKKRHSKIIDYLKKNYRIEFVEDITNYIMDEMLNFEYNKIPTIENVKKKFTELRYRTFIFPDDDYLEETKTTGPIPGRPIISPIFDPGNDDDYISTPTPIKVTKGKEEEEEEFQPVFKDSSSSSRITGEKRKKPKYELPEPVYEFDFGDDDDDDTGETEKKKQKKQ
jgi:serine/threonine protein kinase